MINSDIFTNLLKLYGPIGNIIYRKNSDIIIVLGTLSLIDLNDSEKNLIKKMTTQAT